MSETEKKGITVKIDADLHAQVRQYIEANGMTMAEFVSKALDDELHPKTTIKEEKYMGNMRTMAFQVPEDLFLQIKDYLDRHHMTQKQFVLGLIQDELDRDYGYAISIRCQNAQRGKKYRNNWIKPFILGRFFMGKT